MAKPIRATPTLRGKDAAEFLRRMRIEETRPITEKDRELARRIAAFKL
ncbi:hypothetical protein L6303_01955 [archaeon]|nr:hypothetical protein [Nanoarchaeota archaeon]MBU4451788.1 hypothetical protein [Nanoarchaeota archaeon]MCG2723483.1 hypothetical protein [archaeon]